MLKTRLPVSLCHTSQRNPGIITSVLHIIAPHTRPRTVCRNASFTTEQQFEPTLAKPKEPPTSAYIHLPFCRKRCHYCDFPIVALGSTSSQPGYDNDPRISNYIQLLLREIKATKPVSDSQTPLETVFFGGGTPSLVPPHLIASVLDALKSKVGLTDEPEISIEMDPGTFDNVRLREILELGVNRVSLGVQSFQEELLRVCGRAHGLKEVYEAIEMVSSCEGLKNWSMDLISSLPHQTEKMWEESLKCTVDAGPTHVSVYDLQVEQGTKFAQLYTPGVFPLPTDVLSADFYKMASKTLTEAGYNHYEISSYAKDAYQCKHNLTYWQNNKSFYGFGLGSASYTNGIRFSRPKRLKEYAEWVQRLEDGTVSYGTSEVEVKEVAMDVVMLSLRTARGLDLKEFGREFGWQLVGTLCEAFRPFVDRGLVIPLDRDRRVLSGDDFKFGEGETTYFVRLSDPDGFLLSNELISVAFGVIAP
ncbi:radical SAM superfamily protein [Carex rostrata]